jgi:hypothetical protein
MEEILRFAQDDNDTAKDDNETAKDENQTAQGTEFTGTLF